jgi:uncharacterized protein (DUF433 family)
MINYILVMDGEPIIENTNYEYFVNDIIYFLNAQDYKLFILKKLRKMSTHDIFEILENRFDCQIIFKEVS